MTTIASAVLAGYKLSQRLMELKVEDDQVRTLVGDLAGSLGSIMDLVEKVDKASAIVSRAAQNDDLSTVVEGIGHIKDITTVLVSDQQSIMDTLYGGMSREELQLVMLMEALMEELGAEGADI